MSLVWFVTHKSHKWAISAGLKRHHFFYNIWPWCITMSHVTAHTFKTSQKSAVWSFDTVNWAASGFLRNVSLTNYIRRVKTASFSVQHVAISALHPPQVQISQKSARCPIYSIKWPHCWLLRSYECVRSRRSASAMNADSQKSALKEWWGAGVEYHFQEI